MGALEAYADVLLEEDLRVLPLAPTTPALTVGDPVRVRLRGRPPPNPQPRSSRPHPRSQAQWYFVVANRHPKPKETASIPALTSTSTPDDCISSSPDAIQVYPRIRSSRTPPTPSTYLDSRAMPMRFPTTHMVFEEVHPPRAAARRTCARGGLAPRDNTRAGVLSLESSRDLCPARGGDAPRARRAPTHPPSEVIGSLPRFKKIKNAESSGAPGTVEAVAFWRVSGRGTWIRRCPSRAILCHPSSRSSCLPTSTPPQVAAEKILRDGAERSNRCKQLRLGLDYTNRPTVFSPPSVHLIYTAQDTGAHLHPVLPTGLFATHLISSRRALPHLDYATMRFRGDVGSRSNVLAWRARPSAGSVHPASRPHGAVFEEVRSRCSSVTCTRRPGSSGRRRRCAEHAGFALPCSKHADRRAYPYIHPILSHRPHLDRTQLGFHNAVFVLLEQRTHCALSAYPPPVSAQPWRAATPVQLRQLELELLELWCGPSTPKGSGGLGAGEGR
ncbi:hypothetical protein B0H14DRAFT_3906535 [Mycena olivaceomarginata]|nr:hypothetical protein B0H14DRAFT_3906535 [Mycena olivaceomarginata]